MATSMAAEMTTITPTNLSPSSSQTETLVHAPTESSESNDYYKEPTTRDKFLVICIAIADFGEKIIYYGIVTNLVIFCTNYLAYSSAEAAVFSLVFTGTNYVLTIFGGWVSDGCLGNYNAMFLGLLLCLIGTGTLPLIAYDWPAVYGPSFGLSLGTRRRIFIVILTIVNIGTSPIKACAAPLSAIQVEEYGNKAIQITYHWVYFISEIAPLFSYSVLAYVEQSISFFVGFIVIFSFNIAIIIIFGAGRDFYKNRSAQGNTTMRKIFKMLKTATILEIGNGCVSCSRHCCCCCKATNQTPYHRPSSEKSPLFPNSIKSQIMMRSASNDDATTSSDVAYVSNVDVVSDIESGHGSCLDRLDEANGGSYTTQDVEELECLLNTLLVLSVAILYNAIRFQYSTTYLLQAERLNLNGFPAAFLALFVPLFVIITVPLVDRIVYPLLERIGIRLTLIKRIACGLVFALLSTLSAALVEVSRKRVMRDGGKFGQEISGAIFTASTLSIFVQIPQYMFIGIGDVFTLITSLEFAFSQSPKSLQAFITGIYLFYNGVGGYVGSLLVVIVNAATAGQEWIPNDINKGHLEYFFLVLAGVIILNMIYLYVITRNYKYVTQYER